MTKKQHFSRCAMAGKPEKGFKIEYAKSGRAGCKGCGEKIAEQCLRLGKMIPSPHFDGFVPQWHHVKCWFGKKNSTIPDGIADIEGFMDIGYDDQKLIKDFLSGNAVVEQKQGGVGKSKGKKGPGKGKHEAARASGS